MRTLSCRASDIPVTNHEPRKQAKGKSCKAMALLSACKDLGFSALEVQKLRIGVSFADLGLKVRSFGGSGRSMKNNLSGLGLLAQNGAGAGALGVVPA